jgi:hypothetical protein
MKTLLTSVSEILLATLVAPSASAAVIFQDNFDKTEMVDA